MRPGIRYGLYAAILVLAIGRYLDSDDELVQGGVSPLAKPRPAVGGGAGLRPAADGKERVMPTPAMAASDPLETVQRLLGRQAGGEVFARGDVPAWHAALQALIYRGDLAVPELVMLFRAGWRIGFAGEDSVALGYGTVREGMIQTLAQIGSGEAINALLTLLDEPATPSEIGRLSRHLEVLAPGNFRGRVVVAARRRLAQARQEPVTMDDVAPLFAILVRQGGNEAVEDLERAASRWDYYAATALAQLPDGAGIPALQKLLMPPGEAGPAPRRIPALVSLAQLATDYPEARAILVDHLASEGLPASAWPNLLRALTGEQAELGQPVDVSASNRLYTGMEQLGAGTQSLCWYLTARSADPSAVESRLMLLEELGMVTTDPDARAVLGEALRVLEARKGTSDQSG